MPVRTVPVEQQQGNPEAPSQGTDEPPENAPPAAGAEE
jgi:hypothetical protein